MEAGLKIAWIMVQICVKNEDIYQNSIVLRGRLRISLSDEWSWLRPSTMLPDGTEYSVVEEIEKIAGIPIHKLPIKYQCSVLGHFLREWMIEGSLFPSVNWINVSAKMPASNLAAQCVLQATYKNVTLFDSDHLTLFSVLIAQCMSALGPENYFRQCMCNGCKAHQGSCSETDPTQSQSWEAIILLQGMPSKYTSTAKERIEKKKNKKGRSNQHE